ncbi:MULTISPECIES: hypothetical protein [unclassified Streptomyces]|uniref:hypothetical protein n=1 Tax=unclassified Streptomyces TaxID=2593676 RepID=UPI00036A96BE|nr:MULTISPECIES: hypothetical protein [unclassified Streptomyces]MYX38997.1 hypothetical protein [Streptomyces sp. SID8377]
MSASTSRSTGKLAPHFTADEIEQLLRAVVDATFFDAHDMSPRRQALAARVDKLIHLDMAGKLPDPPEREDTGDEILATAMRTAITGGTGIAVDLFPDGFEITGPDDESLYRSARTHTRRGLATFLGIAQHDVHPA